MVVVQLLGGMGNQMFQYAFAKHLALLNKSDLIMDTSLLENRQPLKDFTFRSFDLDIFNISGTVAKKDEIPLYPSNKSIKSIPDRLLHLSKLMISGFRYVREFQHGFNPGFLNQRGKLYLDGYWQSPLYFDGIENDIKKEFTLKAPLGGQCAEIYDLINGQNSVCIHVRRTDFLRKNPHIVLGSEYINLAIKKLLVSVKDPVFFVFSDDIEWCKQNLAIGFEHYFIGKETEGFKTRDNFKLMMSCKHFIIPNSSYSWWAAWLCENKDKTVIAPKQWTTGKDIKTEDLVPNGWICI